MSDCGFRGVTPENETTLTLGVAYTFVIGIITDDANGFTTEVQPVASAGTITKDPAGAVVIGDTSSGAPSNAEFQVTPTSLGTLTVDVLNEVGDGDTPTAPGSGTRTYTVEAAAVPVRSRTGLSIGLSIGL